MSYELPLLPRFKTGALLGAGDLNRLGQTQAYIKQSLNRFNVAFFYMEQDQIRHVCHRHRYLHWATTSASGADLEVNGVVVDTASGTSGYADLDALGLTTNAAYEAVWTGATTVCKRLYEWPDTSGTTLTLPETSPTFGGGSPSAVDLNKVSTNTQYLLNSIGKRPYTPFVARRWGIAPSKNIKFGVRKTHRYLFFTGQLWYGGEEGSEAVNWNWRINSTTIRSFDTSGTAADGGNYYIFNWWYDLQGTDHTDSSIDQFLAPQPVTWIVPNGSSLSLSSGDWYEFEMDISEAHSWSRIRIELIGESPQKSIW
jgi:hypothetical protein